MILAYQGTIEVNRNVDRYPSIHGKEDPVGLDGLKAYILDQMATRGSVISTWEGLFGFVPGWVRVRNERQRKVKTLVDELGLSILPMQLDIWTSSKPPVLARRKILVVIGPSSDRTLRWLIDDFGPTW